MSYRNLMFKSQKVNPKARNPWRKYQKSKLPSLVTTKTKMVLKLVPVKDDKKDAE